MPPGSSTDKGPTAKSATMRMERGRRIADSMVHERGKAASQRVGGSASQRVSEAASQQVSESAG